MRFSEEYFGDWLKVFNTKILSNILISIGNHFYPPPDNIFRAFHLCFLHNTKVVFIGQDPYPQPNIATGIAFANKDNIHLSSSLNILKEAAVDYTAPKNSCIFDPTLEDWCKQGILLLNSALTVLPYKPESHIMMWRPFMIDLLKTMSLNESGIIYVLLGNQAQTLEGYINHKTNYVLKEKHPSYYARINKRMPSDIFYSINKICKLLYNIQINWFKEL